MVSTAAAVARTARVLRLALVFLALLVPIASLAAVEFEISPDPVIAGQSCRLTFRLAGSATGDPDFSRLAEHFDIVSRQQRSSLNFTNGRREQWTIWELTAVPLATGTVEIPAINFGADSTVARRIDIVDAPPAAQGAIADILFEVEIDTGTPYVQQQVIYTVRVLHRVELSGPRRSAIETSSDTIIKPLGDARRFRDKRDGRSYDVIEHRFAIFPQESGRLEIAPLTLTTQIVDRPRRSFFDPFSQSLQTRRLRSEGLTLDVRPKPAAYPNDATWLPARRLRLHDEWDPESRETEAGTPLSRTVFLWAEGLTAGQLPELDIAAPPALRVYPDQPQSNERPGDDGFTAVVQRKFALIAGSAMDHTLAGIRIAWWNLDTDQLEYAVLEPVQLRYLPANSGPANDAAGGDALARAPDAGAVLPAGGHLAAAGERHWRWLALLFAVGWAMTAILWWRHRHGQRERGSEAGQAAAATQLRGRAQATRALKQACEQGDAAAARDALLAWAGAGGNTTRGSLRDIRRQVSGAEFAAAIVALERALYGPAASSDFDGAALWATFQREPREDHDTATGTPAGLPPLFKLAGE